MNEPKVNRELKYHTIQLEQTELLSLFEIDMSKYGVANICFYNGANTDNKDVVYQGKSYMSYPCDFSGVSFSSTGASSRPTLTVANISGLITELVNKYDYLTGLKLYRRQVFVEFLDAINFKDGNRNANTEANITSFFVFETLKSINHKVATFELALPFELDGLKVPKRVMLVKDFPGINRL